MNDCTMTEACVTNPYYYETIPAPAVVINTPPPVYQMSSNINCTTMSMGAV
jgi:hypothetical protein